MLLALGCSDEPTTVTKPLPGDWAIPAFGEPVWSPDGTRIGFNHRPLIRIETGPSGRHNYIFQDSLLGFWMVDSSGNNLHRVMAAFAHEPAWSPDGLWVAFQSGADIYKSPATTTGIDTAGIQRLTFQGVYHGPAWSPNSTSLLIYRSDSFGTLYKLWAGGGGPEPVGEYGWREPNWAPAESVVFTGTVQGAYGVAVCDTLGMGARVLTSAPDTPQLPKWSPDLSRIAFLARANDQQYLWVMDADGGNQRIVSPSPVGEGFSWSPDGARIAYVRFSYSDHTYSNGTVWIVDVTTNAAHQLTFNGPDAPP